MSRLLLMNAAIAALLFSSARADGQAPRKVEVSPTTLLLDGFVKTCDIKNPAWQELWAKESVKIAYRGHSVSRILSADSDGGSVVRVFFDDVLQPDDESGLAALWYPKQRDLAEARNASGEVSYADRKWRRGGSNGEQVTLQLIRFANIDRQTGNPVENGRRKQYAEAPKSARWLIECAISF